MKFSENWLHHWVNPGLTAAAFTEQLTMAGIEVESIENVEASKDRLIEVELTPNRGDCLSILGLAREIAALNRISLNAVEFNSVKPTLEDKLEIDIQAEENCPRYIGRVIRHLKSPLTVPDWLKTRLAASEIGAIHPVVDILNYVMLELGQPMHAFDADKIQAPIRIRLAEEGEKMLLLNEQQITLKAGTLVIADKAGPVAIAGIMGGQASAVTSLTTNVFLESALFTPTKMAGKARQYGLHTDSSFRFERGVDPDLQIRAMERATQLILEICQGEAGPLTQVVKESFLPKQATIMLRLSRLQKIIGKTISQDTVQDILQRLGCALEITENPPETVWQVTPSSYRYDLTAEIDLIEEVVRVVGYNNIENTLPVITTQFIAQSESVVPTSRIKRALVDLGYQEVITYSFVAGEMQQKLFPETALALLNPISAELDKMRLSLWPGLLTTLKYNQYRQQNRLKLFEIGLCFNFVNNKLEQTSKIGGLMCGDFANESWGIQKRASDFYDVKQSLEALWQLLGNRQRLTFSQGTHSACHPGQCAQITYQEKQVGVIGKLHPELEKQLGLEGPIFLFELALIAFSQSPQVVFQRSSRFPEIRRDIAMIVDENLQSEDLIKFVSKAAGENCREVKIFDVYTGKGIDSGRKSIAMGLILQHPSRTLVDTEVDEMMQNIIVGLKKEFSAQLRD